MSILVFLALVISILAFAAWRSGAWQRSSDAANDRTPDRRPPGPFMGGGDGGFGGVNM